VAVQERGDTLSRARCQVPAAGSWSVPVAVAVALVAFAARFWVVLHGHGFYALAGYDQGVYYAAADALVHGLRPYGGFLLLHPPGIMLLLSPFAVLGSVTSDSTGMAVARFAVVLLGALNAVLVTWVARRFGLVAGVAGGLFYALWAPVVVLENQTRLEPFGNTCLLLALLGLLRRRAQPVSGRVQVLAGAALGAGAAVKIWGVLPLLVVLGWQLLDRGWRPGARVAGGAVAAVTAICLPFFLMAPDAMFRMVITDQLDRPLVRSDLVSRLSSLSSLDLSTPLSGSSEVMLAAFGLLAGAAVLLAWRERAARVVVVLLVAQTALLLRAPSYFPDYAAFVVPAAALTFALASARVALWLAGHGRGLQIAGVAVVSTAVLTAAVRVVPLSVGYRMPFPGPALGEAAEQQRCLVSDTPIALIEMDALSRDLRNGCGVHVDVTGYTYEGELALGPGDRLLARPRNAAWQRQLLGYLRSGNAVILARGKGTGLSRASKRVITQWPVLSRIDGYTLFARRAKP
jgi:alpha-1,2-mannosyltransferase